MNSSIIMDYLISKNNGDLFFYDNRTCSEDLLKEIILQGFQIRNHNPLSKEDTGRIKISEGKSNGDGNGNGDGGEYLFHSLGSGSGYGFTSGWGLFYNYENRRDGIRGLGAGLSPFGEGNGRGGSESDFASFEDYPQEVKEFMKEVYFLG